MMRDEIIPPKHERIMVGALFISVDFVAMIHLAVVIMAILLDSKMRSMAAYRLMLYIAILDFIHLCVQCVGGFITIWPIENEFPTKFAAGLMESSWICMICLTFVLSVNRLQIIVDKPSLEKCFAIFCKIMSVTSGLFCLVIFTIFLTPLITMRYKVERYAWLYVRSKFSFIFAITISSFLTTLSLFSFCNYAIILFATARKKRIHFMQTNPISSVEMRILAQSVALFTFTTICVFLDFFNFYLLPPTKWTYLCLTIVRQICTVMIPFLNLIFNNAIRTKAISFFLKSSKVTTTHPIPSIKVTELHAQRTQPKLFMKTI